MESAATLTEEKQNKTIKSSNNKSKYMYKSSIKYTNANTNYLLPLQSCMQTIQGIMSYEKGQ